jgi:hypothetical protein
MTHLLLAAVLLSAPVSSDTSDQSVEYHSLLYRVASYDTHYLNRDLLTECRENDARLQQLWKNCGQTEADREAVVAWYEAAIGGETLPLPDLSLSSRNPYARTFTPQVVGVGSAYPTIEEYDTGDYDSLADPHGTKLLKSMGRALVIGIAAAKEE